MCRDRVVSVVTGYGLHVTGFKPRLGQDGSHLFTPIQTDPEAHPASCGTHAGTLALR